MSTEFRPCHQATLHCRFPGRAAHHRQPWCVRQGPHGNGRHRTRTTGRGSPPGTRLRILIPRVRLMARTWMHACDERPRQNMQRDGHRTSGRQHVTSIFATSCDSCRHAQTSVPKLEQKRRIGMREVSACSTAKTRQMGLSRTCHPKQSCLPRCAPAPRLAPRARPLQASRWPLGTAPSSHPSSLCMGLR